MLMIKIIVVVMIMINNNNMVDVVYTLPARAPQWPMLPFSTPHFYVFSVIRIFALPFFFGAILSYSYSFDPKAFVSCCSCLVLDTNSWLNVSSEASFLLCPNCLPLLAFRPVIVTFSTQHTIRWHHLHCHHV